MLNRQACERRVYRLATLLTGNPVAAAQVIAQVVDAQPDVRHLDNAHMDRLTVLRSRDIKSSMLVDESLPHTVAAALAALTAQQCEAWVFARVYGMDIRELSRAMDCSVTATQRHLEQADATMKRKLGDQVTTAPQVLLSYSMTLDVPLFYRKQRQRKRRMKLAIVLAAAAFLITIVGVCLWWWSTHIPTGG